ncbi:MAG: hypothetical protein IJ640_09085 [Prevotella sp.]|nr:hypothetical protein [Prevotella sp.]
MEEQNIQIPNAAKTVSSAIIGYDVKVVLVNGKRYAIKPPTIQKMAGGAYWLSTFDRKGKESIDEIIMAMTEIEPVAKSLSWMIQGDESLFDELKQGTLDENIVALCTAFSLINTENFTMLSALARNVGKLIAKPKRQQ